MGEKYVHWERLTLYWIASKNKHSMYLVSIKENTFVITSFYSYLNAFF